MFQPCRAILAKKQDLRFLFWSIPHGASGFQSVVHNVNTGSWLEVGPDRWQYFADDEQKSVAARVSRHTYSKWQIEYHGLDGVIATAPGFVERLSIAKRVVEAKFRKHANAASAQ